MGLERDVCNDLLGALVDAKFLLQTRDGSFIRLEGARPTRGAPLTGDSQRKAVA